MKYLYMFVMVVLVGFYGCSSKNTEEIPTFTLAYSEYPSWSLFGVAHEKGLLNGKKGEQGTIEKKYGIDIVLKEADYDACLTLFASGAVDANCQTNIDSMAAALGRDSVMILPTSTSVGGDACIAVGFKGTILDFLAAHPTFGLEKSVSQYVFEENLKRIDPKVNLKQFGFRNMDPAAAAQAMQTGQPNINSIMVWNPFVLQTLRTKKDSRVLFDSSTIPEEVIDSVVAAKDSLSKDKGPQFALAVIETYYEVCKMLDDPNQADETYVALGAKFSNLNAQDMRLVCTQTKFYNTPKKALTLMGSKKFQDETMPKVVDFCVSHNMVDKKPTVGFSDSTVQFNIDNAYLKKFMK